MAAYFPKFLATYNNDGAIPNKPDARQTLDFQGFPGFVYISGALIHSCGRCRRRRLPLAGSGEWCRPARSEGG